VASGVPSGVGSGEQRGKQLLDRVLGTLGDPALSPPEVEAALQEILRGLPAPHASDLFGLRARFAARLACALDSGDELAELGPVWGPLAFAEWPAWTAYEVADAHLGAGRAHEALRAARHGLEALPRARLTEPGLWHVQEEAARMLGEWEVVEVSIAGLGESLAPHEGEEPLPATIAQRYRSRWLQARAQAFQDLGLLELSGPLVDEALEEALASGHPETILAARMQALDQVFLRGDDGYALEIVRAGLADPRLAAYQAKLRLAEGVVHVERAREARAGGEDPAPLAAEARAAFAAAHAGATLLERLKAALWSCDLETSMGRFAEARQALEQARARAAELGPSMPVNEAVLLPMLAWRLARSGNGPEPERRAAREALFTAYDRFLEHWFRAPRRPGGIGFLQLAWRTQVVSEVLEAELEEGGARRAFERLLEVQSMGTTARERGLVVGLPEARALLAPGRGMLVLLPAQDHSHLFVLDDEAGITHERIPARRADLRKMAGEITGALSNPEGRIEARAVRALHDLLLPASVQERMRSWSQAWVIGFDLLRDLPFGVLVGADGRCEGERMAMVTMPSVAQAVDATFRARARPRAGQGVVLVVASDPPAGHRGALAFDFGKEKREHWLAPFRGRTVTVLQGRKASLGGLRELGPVLAEAGVLHVIAHGITVHEDEYPIALLLSGAAPAEEQVLRAEDILALEFDGIVVLSACGSGLGPQRLGDDRLMNLGGAFLEAGARCVVLARFPVEYEATQALMERFDEALARGEPPAEALRRARAELGGLAGFHAAAFEVLGAGFEAP
jgi:CHAT domain-containing protein